MVSRNRPTSLLKPRTRGRTSMSPSAMIRGRAVDVTAPATVTFSMRNTLDNSVKVDTVVSTALNARRGEGRHSWTATQTNMVGEYEGEFIVTDSGRGGCRRTPPTGS